MSGKFLLDTNAVISLLNGNQHLLNLVKDAEWVGISIIVELEFLSFPQLSENDAKLFQRFKGRIEVVGLDAGNTEMMETTIRLRQNFNVKLPDAIIAAAAMQKSAVLLSNDTVFGRIPDLELNGF